MITVTSGKIKSAKKVVVYGVEGVGKTTLVSKFPDPLFIDTEGSTKELDVKRLPVPESWQYIYDEIEYVLKNPTVCKTLVIDTIDWAERLCIQSICAKHDKKGIEDFGYGNGYVYEKEEFGRFLNRLEDIIKNGINVVLTAHSVVRKFEQPNEMGAYDRYEMKLGQKTTSLIAPMVREWADAIFFCTYKTLSVAVDDKGKKHKAQGGKRVMYTTHHPCWDAKNRYGLADELPLDYSQIAHIFDDTNYNEPMPTIAPVDTSDRMVDSEPPTTTVEPTPTVPGIPKALQDLMNAAQITEDEIREAVASKGYFPIDMPIADYPQDFIEGVLICAWDQVKEMINSKGDMPF